MRRRADMEVYFRPDEERPQGDGTEDGAFPRPPSFPPEVLERHGARMLRPTEAVRAPGTRAPQPTAYRAGILLVRRDQPGARRHRAALRSTTAAEPACPRA